MFEWFIIRGRYVNGLIVRTEKFGARWRETCRPSKVFFLPPATVKVLGTVVLVGIVLIRTVVVDVVFIVHALCTPLGLVLRLLLVEPVLALCLSELVDLGTGKTGEQFFRELVGYGLAWSDRVSLPCTRDTVGGREDVPSLR